MDNSVAIAGRRRVLGELNGNGKKYNKDYIKSKEKKILFNPPCHLYFYCSYVSLAF